MIPAASGANALVTAHPGRCANRVSHRDDQGDHLRHLHGGARQLSAPPTAIDLDGAGDHQRGRHARHIDGHDHVDDERSGVVARRLRPRPRSPCAEREHPSPDGHPRSDAAWAGERHDLLLSRALGGPGRATPRAPGCAGAASSLASRRRSTARAPSGRPMQLPDVVSANDPSAVELGVKFRSSANGFMTGIRFYKGPQNTGAHVGHLWTNVARAARQRDLAGESATGWQQATFDSRVADRRPSTTYVVSYSRTERVLLRRQRGLLIGVASAVRLSSALANAAGAATVSSATVRGASQRRPSTARTTGWTWSSSPACRRTVSLRRSPAPRPVAGATDARQRAHPRHRFSEAMDVSSITAATRRASGRGQRTS